MAVVPIAPHRQRAYVKVIVGGEDVTAKINERLLSLTIIDRLGGMDECHLELDDREGRIRLPAGPDEISVELGWPNEGSFTAFKGKTADLWSAGQKQGGRTLTISAMGADLQNDTKAPMQWSLGDGQEDVKIGDAMKKAGELAGNDIKVSPDLAKLTRKFWMGNNESFMAFAQRIAGGLAEALRSVAARLRSPRPDRSPMRTARRCSRCRLRRERTCSHGAFARRTAAAMGRHRTHVF